MEEQQTPARKLVALRQAYIKDLSFESPKSPGIFVSEVDTEILVDIQSNSRTINEETVEVTLTLTVKSVAQEETMFLIELAQAGLFTIRGFTGDERIAMLATECPEKLYSYARVAVAEVANRGGFPELLLQPVDFYALFEKNVQQLSGTQN